MTKFVVDVGQDVVNLVQRRAEQQDVMAGEIVRRALATYEYLLTELENTDGDPGICVERYGSLHKSIEIPR